MRVTKSITTASGFSFLSVPCTRHEFCKSMRVDNALCTLLHTRLQITVSCCLPQVAAAAAT